MIEIDGVSLAFGDRPVLRETTLTVLPGLATFVVGVSGAGKSVLSRCAVGLQAPDAGAVRLFEKDLAQCHPRELAALRRRCPLVLQGSALLDDLSLVENVALALRFTGTTPAARIEKAMALLDRVGLQTQAHLHPHDVGPGVAMRTAIARALALEPAMVVFDEPTSGLDPTAARQIDRLIAETARATGALVISHDLDSIFTVADRIVMLHAGSVHAEGTPAEIRAHADPIVRQFIEGRADGPIPDW